LIYSHPRPLLMWRLSSSLSSSSTWVMYLNFNEEVTCEKFGSLKKDEINHVNCCYRQKPASLPCPSHVQAYWIWVAATVDMLPASSLFKARPVMTIFVFENTNNGKGTLRSILNVAMLSAWRVVVKGKPCCAVDVPLNFNQAGQRLAGVGVTVVAGVLGPSFLCP
jgi:hypothetical protein